MLHLASKYMVANWMCYFELIVNSLNLAKIIDDSKTYKRMGIRTYKSSSSKIIDGSKTVTQAPRVLGPSSSSKIIDGSKTSN